MKKWFWGTLVILAGIFTGCAKQENSAVPEPEVIMVKTAPVVTRDVSRKVTVTGILQAKKKTALSFKIGGIIKLLKKSRGDFVRKGMWLASLDKTEIDARLKTANAAFEKAVRDKNRIEALYKDEVATKEQYENTLTQFKIAQSNLIVAQYNNEHAQIWAPFSGWIVEKLQDEGAITGAGSPVYVMADIKNSLILKAGAASSDLPFIKTGSPATVTLDVFPDKTFAGTVSLIPVSANRQSGLFDIEISVPNPDNVLMQGYVAKASIRTDAKNPTHSIPVNALVQADYDRGYVFRITGGKAEQIPVKILEIRGETVIIAHVFDSPARIATEGVNYLVDGCAVKETSN